jgi:hypothetical protein
MMALLAETYMDFCKNRIDFIVKLVVLALFVE